MTITYPITFPTVIRPTKTRWMANTADGASESPFTLEQQVYLWPGGRWEVDVSMPPMRRDKAEAFVAAMISLKGRYGTLLFGDYEGRAPRGVASGSPLVNGASQVGYSLVTDGWTAGVTGILKAGDYIQLGSGTSQRMYKNLQDVNSNGSGQATLDIWPSLRGSPADNAVITVTNCMTVMQQAGPYSWDANEVSTYGMSFRLVERIP